MLVAGAKAATQTPPIRSGRRVIFSTLDDGSGLVDLAFFDDSHDACAHTVFHSWLLLVRGVVQRRGPRSLSVVGSPPGTSPTCWRCARRRAWRASPPGWPERAGREGRTGPGATNRGRPGAPPSCRLGRTARAGRAAAQDPMEQRKIRMSTGYESTPGPIAPRGRRARGRKEGGTRGEGRPRATQAPMYEAPLPELLGLLEEFTPVVEALPPDGALADLRGAERYFGRDAVELASVIRVQRPGPVRRGLRDRCPRPGPMLARMALRDARPGLTRAVPVGEERDFLAGKPVAALPGVGAATARTLCEYGLDTLGRVAIAPLSTLQRLVGARTGRELHEKANGVDRGRVVPNGVSRSLAADRPFDRDELDPDRHRRALLSAAGELGARLRAVDKVCRTLTLTVRYADRSATTRSRTLKEPTAHSAALTRTAYDMYEALGLQRARVRTIALRAEGLAPAEQASTSSPSTPWTRRSAGSRRSPTARGRSSGRGR
ncbi:DNA polymerase IV [Streptomyces violaceorubidus]